VSEEVKPPAGTSLTLDRSQLRYCLSENIRLDLIERLVNTRSNVQVDSYNARVEDYNARCSQYRYYRNDMDAARASVESRRSALDAEARTIVASWR
jgi:hypothetical protein